MGTPWAVHARRACADPAPRCRAQENRREYERKVKEIVEQSWADGGDEAP